MKFKKLSVYALLGIGLIAAFSVLLICSPKKSQQMAPNGKAFESSENQAFFIETQFPNNSVAQF